MQSDVIAVCLAGGLGNQLFQYAAGRAASLRNRCRLALDFSILQSSSGDQVKRQFMLDAFKIDAIADPSTRYDELREYSEKTYCFDPEILEVSAGRKLRGYFQSELYFSDCKGLLREDLNLIATVSPSFSELAERIRKTDYSVSLHLRRGDFVTDRNTNKFHGVCDREYYQRAIRIVAGLASRKPTYFVFSDDRREARRIFKDLERAEFVDTPLDRPWEDLVLMSLCDDNILANSSLSWWAAWRNDNPAKTIVAPRRWVSPAAMRSLNTCDLYLEGTIII